MNIKKSLALCAVAAAFTGCSLDLPPEGSIGSDNAFATIQDARNLRNFQNVLLRGNTQGGIVYSQELQTDLFNITAESGNNGAEQNRWTFTSGYGDAASIFAGMYGCIANINYYLQEYRKLDLSKFTEKEQAELNLYFGEMHFERAYYYSVLVEKFCDFYTESTASEKLGMPYIKEYAPTAVAEKYPARPSLKETYDEIFKDLDTAATYLTTPGAPDNIFLTADVVKGLQARMALYTQNWALAAEKASEIINSGVYTLINDAELFKNMWINDNGKESMVQFYGSKSEMPGSNNFGYCNFNAKQNIYSAYMIPTTLVLDMYDTENDIRYPAYFGDYEVKGQGQTWNLVLCHKYYGNPEFMTGTEPNYQNKGKFFRIAEQYLIAAEAYAMNGDASNANKYLNALRKARIKGYTDVNLSGDELIQAIRDERVKELFAEGFRLNDLKRYNEGFSRENKYQGDGSALYLPGDASTTDLTIESGNFRFIYPIPQAECDANPQIQQNPGYTAE